MCGIAGFINNPHISRPKEVILKMTSQISHRGPDAESFKVEDQITFGHRRLSIQDLSPFGAQPMASDSGRYLITYNGEIYNFLKLRKTLENSGASTFRGHSDTEVLLKYLDQYGLKKTLDDIKGMFAFALLDKLENKLFLIRDRMGEKPLYYFSKNEHLSFSSELRSLEEYPFLKKEICKEALQLYFKYNCIPAPYCIYKNVFKLEPGSILELDLLSQKTSVEKYWDIEKVALEGMHTPITNPSEALTTLEEKLTSVIEEQMISDVPYGAFLSGGVDSSLIVSLMQKLSKRPINTFTIGFNEKGFDEAIYAKKVAQHLGTNHSELYLTQKECLDVIPKLPSIYSEPFSDSSQIPTFLVSQMAKRDVTVCLSGDGGDELFAGYNRHFWIEKIWKLKKRITPLGTFALNSLIKTVPTKNINDFGNLVFNGKIRSLGDTLLKANRAISQNTQNDLYDSLISHFHLSSNILRDKPLKNDPLHIESLSFQDDCNRFLLQDQKTYLPNDILTKVDRAAMANSLETRVPFLDEEIVRFSWRIPFELKCQNTLGKIPLRSILYKYVPKNLIERPKAGFGIPLDTWLRKDLREWVEDLLSQKNIDNSGLLDHKIVSKMWNEHVSGSANWQYHLWDIIMFQSWYLQNR